MRKLKTIMVTLKNGPLDTVLLRIEGERLPTMLLFGPTDPEDFEGIVSAYEVVDPEETEGRHFTFRFTGQCNLNMLPTFLWDPDWWDNQ